MLQFSDKLDGMLNSLSNTADQLKNAEPVSAHVEKIEEQLHDNQTVLQDLDKRSNALEAVKRAADDVIVKAGGARDPAVKGTRNSLFLFDFYLFLSTNFVTFFFILKEKILVLLKCTISTF